MTKPGLVEIHPEPVGEGVVEFLEDLLENARKGELSAIAVATLSREGCIGSGWSRIHNYPSMLGSVTRLSHKINQAMDEASE